MTKTHEKLPELKYFEAENRKGKKYEYWRVRYKGKQHLFAYKSDLPNNGKETALREWLALKQDIDSKENGKAEIDVLGAFNTEILNLELLRRVYAEDENHNLESLCVSRMGSLRNLIKQHKKNGEPLLLEGNSGGEPPVYGLSEYGIMEFELEQYGERMEKLKKASPPNQFVDYQITKFLEAKKADGVSLGRQNNIKQCLDVFAEWFGKDKLITEATGEVLIDFRNKLVINELDEKLVKKDASDIFKRDIIECIKQWIRWMDEVEVLKSIPKCAKFRSKSLNIEVDHSEKVNNVFTNKEIKKIFEKSNERNRLYYLLMLNTSMTQIDIANMKKCEFLEDEKRIVRKRSKTRKKVKVPLVGFKLWDETYNLLMKFKNTDNTNPETKDLLLLNERGRKIKSDKILKDGKYTKSDSIASAWFRLKKETKINKEVTTFRNTGAERIKDEFGHGLSRLFLGHAPMGVAEINYQNGDIIIESAETQVLDKAIDFLYDSYEVKKLTVED